MPNRGQTQALEGWKRTRGSRESVWKGCMSWCIGVSLEPCTSCLQRGSGSAAVSHPPRYHFPPSCVLEQHQLRQRDPFLRLPQSFPPGTQCRVAPQGSSHPLKEGSQGLPSSLPNFFTQLSFLHKQEGDVCSLLLILCCQQQLSVAQQGFWPSVRSRSKSCR